MPRGLALLPELVPERPIQRRKVEGEAGVEQPPREDAMSREQRLFAHLTEHELHCKLGNRGDSRTMQHTVTVHDPKAYTQDWMNVRTWRIKPAPDVLMEYSCEENNLQSLLEGAIKMWTPPTDID